MDAAEFTRFLRSKTLASGKYVPGIPRDSADLLVEKVAKALGICCGGQTGYFYILADIVIDTAQPFSVNIVSEPSQQVVAITDTSSFGMKMGGNITVTNSDIPMAASRVTLIGTNPKTGTIIQGKGVKDTTSLQTKVSPPLQDFMRSALALAINEGAVLPGEFSTDSAITLRMVDTSAKQVIASVINAPLEVTYKR